MRRYRVRAGLVAVGSAIGLLFGAGAADAVAVLPNANFKLKEFGFNQGWRVDRHPRVLADVTNDGKADIVGFAEAGVFVSVAAGNGNFFPAQPQINDFGPTKGWTAAHQRKVVDINNDGMADILGRGNAGIYAALATGGGAFGPVTLVAPNFGIFATPDLDSFYVANVGGDANLDLIELEFNFISPDGVSVALGRGDGSFAAPFRSSNVQAHGCAPKYHVVDITGDQRAEIVASDQGCILVGGSPAAALSGRGVGVLRADANGDFGEAFTPGGGNLDVGGAPSADLLVDVSGDQRPDLVSLFHDGGTYVALSVGDGTFTTALLIDNFGGHEGWRRSDHQVLGGEVTIQNPAGLNRAELVAFGDPGVFVAIPQGGISFTRAHLVITDLAVNQQWTLQRHIRSLADITGDGLDDIVGFGDAGVYVAVASGDGGFS